MLDCAYRSNRSLRLDDGAGWSRCQDWVGVAVRDLPGISLAPEDHGDPQRERTDVPAAAEPRLPPLNLDDIAKVNSAVSRHLLETVYGPVANLCGCLSCGTVDFRRSAGSTVRV